MDIPAIEWPFRPRPGQFVWHNLPYDQRMAVIAACTRSVYRHLCIREARHAA